VAGASGWYDAHAPDLVRRYEATILQTCTVGLAVFSRTRPARSSIGAGSGRDAGWFAAQGYDVVAVEPSTRMRSEAERLHPDPRIRWINDQLPDLTVVGPLAISFDVVMLSAVWQQRATVPTGSGIS
jgi:Methyltransferase domain